MISPGAAPDGFQRDNLIHSDSGTRTLGSVLDEMEQRFGGVDSSRPLVFVGDDPLALVGASAWLAAGRRDGLIVGRDRFTRPVQERLAGEGYSVVDADRGSVISVGTAARVDGRVRLLTSGSTGEAKLVGHTWTSLFTMSRLKRARAARWLLTYQPGTYAWYQLVTAALFLPGQSLILAGPVSPGAMFRLAAAHGATAISATPTFWRIALLQSDPDDLERLSRSLANVTLGGEVVDQAILDTLHRRFPAASVVHIYASTEAGAAIVVGDLKEGFPRDWLDDDARSPRLRVRDGRLQIHSEHAAEGVVGWLDSGDLAEIRDDRVMLLGRADHGTINVGGAKAAAVDIERVLMLHSDVRWCRVRGVKAPLVGSLVAADVVLASPLHREGEAEQWLSAWCGERLPAYMIPRLWRILPEIPAGANWKSEV